MSSVYQIIIFLDSLRQYSKEISDRLGRIYHRKRWSSVVLLFRMKHDDGNSCAVNLNEQKDS